MNEINEHQRVVQVSDPGMLQQLVGTHDQYFKLLESQLDVTITHRGEMIYIKALSDDHACLAVDILSELQKLISRGMNIEYGDVLTAIHMAKNGTLHQFLDLYHTELLTDKQGRSIRPRTFSQKKYVDAIYRRDVVFGIGPAGTGKTFLAIAMAVLALKQGKVSKIIITRPAVEAGENLGFLPGDLKEKVDPYLRPMYDALNRILGLEQTTRLMDRGVIEIAPLAYMRGRTLDEAFVILDEAQNTTVAQMKMFLTRLGTQSKMIINGDPSQVDLPKGVTSGLIHAERVLKDIPEIQFITFSSDDVVRHPVVAQIIQAYQQFNA